MPESEVFRPSEVREEWTSNTAFLFAAIGAAIGLGNVVRFPFLAYKWGGAAFLIPYILAWLLLGIPMMGLEFMLGQRMRARGAPVSCALIHARAWGIGVLAIYTSCLIMLTYNMVMSWTWVFLWYCYWLHCERILLFYSVIVLFLCFIVFDQYVTVFYSFFTSVPQLMQ